MLFQHRCNSLKCSHQWWLCSLQLQLKLWVPELLQSTVFREPLSPPRRWWWWWRGVSAAAGRPNPQRLLQSSEIQRHWTLTHSLAEQAESVCACHYKWDQCLVVCVRGTEAQIKQTRPCLPQHTCSIDAPFIKQHLFIPAMLMKFQCIFLVCVQNICMSLVFISPTMPCIGTKNC